MGAFLVTEGAWAYLQGSQKSAPQTRTYTFDQARTGEIAPEFRADLTGDGPESRWIVTADPTAPSKPNVLAQTTAEKINYRYPLAVVDDSSFRNGELSVKFKVVSGELDRTAGIAFRLIDAKNYYLCRANGVEGNYRIYRVVNGKREKLAEQKLAVTAGEWHELRLQAVDNKLTCYFGGGKLEVVDDTFKDAGKIGLWTKQDSVVHFDDLKVTPTAP